MSYYSKHFKKSEFACRCGQCKYSRDPEMNQKVIVALELVRLFCKTMDPKSYVVINCGRRCDAHNKAVGGADNSMHKKGLAVDIRTPHVKLDVVYKFLNDLFPDTFGLSLYSKFIHLDVRERRARW